MIETQTPGAQCDVGRLGHNINFTNLPLRSYRVPRKLPQREKVVSGPSPVKDEEVKRVPMESHAIHREGLKLNKCQSGTNPA